jgi:hypothetical protein
MIDGIHNVYVETHNWGKSAAFWQAMGYTLAEDHGTSGIFRASAPGQPYIYLAEVPPEQAPVIQLYLHATEEFMPASPARVDGGWEDSHWGTRLLTVHDPDDRALVVQVGEAD